MLSQKSQTSAFRSRWFTSSSPSNCSLFLLLRLAVVKAFSSARTEVGCGSMSSQNWDRAICPSASSKPVVVRPLICSNLPLMPRCRERSYFRSCNRVSSAQSRKPSTHKRTKEKGWRIVLPSAALLCLASAPWKAVMDSFLNSMVFIFAVFLSVQNKQPCLK